MAPSGEEGAAPSPATGRDNAVLSALLSVDGERVQLGFVLLLWIGVGVQLVLTLGYPPTTQLVPFVIGVPVFVLISALLALLLSPRLRAAVSEVTTGDVFGVEERVSDLREEFDHEMEGHEAPAEPDEHASRRKFVDIAGWILGLFSAILLLGFLVGIPVFLVPFYRYRADAPWTKAALYTGVIWFFTYLIFVQIVNAPLYAGLLAELLL